MLLKDFEISKLFQHHVSYSLIFMTQDDGVPEIDGAFLCAHVLLNIYDKEYGGFGSSSATNPNSPKFPEPCNLNFLLSMHVLSTSPMLSEMSLDASLNTLKKMAYGGIHDHLGKVRFLRFRYYTQNESNSLNYLSFRDFTGILWTLDGEFLISRKCFTIKLC